MISTTLFPGRYVQGPDSTKRLGLEFSSFGQKAFGICSPFIFDQIIPKLEKDIQKDIQFVTEKFKRECSDEEISRLISIAEKH